MYTIFCKTIYLKGTLTLNIYKMAITQEELDDLINPTADIEKVSTISSAGETLSTRIPKDVIQEI